LGAVTTAFPGVILVKNKSVRIRIKFGFEKIEEKDGFSYSKPAIV